MSIADKLLELNDVKQDIKIAIEGKGVNMTGVPFTGYPTKIDSITTGPGMSYHDYAKMLYSMWGFGEEFEEAWADSQSSLEVLFEIPLMLVATNQELVAGKFLDLYVGTDSALTDFYNFVAGGEFPEKNPIIINKSLIRYQGDVGPGLGMPFPIYQFGMFLEDNPTGLDEFFLADLTPLGMGLGITLGKPTGVTIPDNSITVRRGFDMFQLLFTEDYEDFMTITKKGLIIPEMIETVGVAAFGIVGKLWNTDRRVPYLIGPNVKYIGAWSFANWDYQQPVNIPDSVEWIGQQAFRGYKKNLNYIVIPRNVTYIGELAFYEYGDYFDHAVTIAMYPEIPPVIENDNVPFYNHPSRISGIYVPTGTKAAYVSAWSEYWDRITERYEE